MIIQSQPPAGNGHPAILSGSASGKLKPLAALQTTREAFPALLARGFWPLLADGKKPIGLAWGLERWGIDKADRTFRKHPSANVGVCLGPGRAPDAGWLADFEGDGPDAEASRAKLFGDEVVATIGWTSTRGRHQLIRLDGDRMTAIVAGLKPHQVKDPSQPGVFKIDTLPGLELRFGGLKPNGVVKQVQSIVPPSLGTDGAPREWNGVDSIADAPEAFYAALESIVAKSSANVRKPTGEAPRPAPGKPFTVPMVVSNNADLWLKGALTNAVGRIEGKAAGERRTAYRNEAYSLAGWLHYNERYGIGYSEQELSQALKSALAIGVGHGDPVVEATVNDAIADGKNAPVDLKPELHDSATGSLSSNGRASNGRPPEGGAVVAQPDSRPTIIVTTEEHDVVDQAVDALAADPTVYQRGFMLATVYRDTIPSKGIIRPPGTPRIGVLPKPRLRERLTKHAAWAKWKKDGDGEFKLVPAHPPDWAVAAVDARGEWPKIRPLESVVEAPVMRHDGTILDTPGYDPSTGLLYEPNASFETVKHSPTRLDAQQAADLLLDLVTDFPFAAETHRAAWLAALLTTLARFAIDGPCPLFLFDAPAAGAGKGLLADLISIIRSGREATRKDFPDCNEEMRKTITAIALAGDPLVLLDNVATTFGGSALDAALTSRTWKDRILGESKMTPDLPLFTIWLATGNNVALKGDILRRIVPCRLVPDVERPEERTDFKHPRLVLHVQKHRVGLVTAALTILRAYVVAGRPDQNLTPFGSYESWSEVVRSAIHWTIKVDPCKAREDLRAADDTAENSGAIIEGWAELPPGTGNGHTAAQALKLVRESPDRLSTLREALMSWSRNDELPSQRTVGVRLKSLRGRIFGGRYVSSTPYKGTQEWSVKTVKPGGDDGDGGSFFQPRAENSQDDLSHTSNSGERGGDNSHQSHQSHQVGWTCGCLLLDCPDCQRDGVTVPHE